MATKKEQPFNYTAANFGAGSQELKQAEAGKPLLICEEANKLQSPQKLIQAYVGLVGHRSLYIDKKYDESSKPCSLEMPGSGRTRPNGRDQGWARARAR